MKKKTPLILALTVLVAGIVMSLMIHGWLYSSYTNKRIHKVTRQIIQIKKSAKSFTRQRGVSPLSLLRVNIRKRNAKKNFFIWDRKLNLVHPRSDSNFPRENKIAEQYVSSRELIKSGKPFLFEAALNHLDFFFQVTYKSGVARSTYYVLLRQNILPTNTTLFLFCLYAVVMILSFLVWLVAYKFTKRFFSLISSVTHSLKNYSQNQYAEVIDYDRADEMGELIHVHNQFIESLELSKPMQHSPLHSNQVQKRSDDENDVRPQLPRLGHLEILLFPGKEHEESASRIIFQNEDEDVLHCLALEMLNHPKDTIPWKERLGDYFLELVNSGFNPDEIVSNLLSSAKESDVSGLGIGFFYGNFNTKKRKMLLFKAGHSSLYVQDTSKSIERLNIGGSDLPAKFDSFTEKKFEPGSSFFLFTSPCLKSLGVSNIDLEENIFSSINYDIDPGRKYLTQVVQKLYSESFTLTPGDKPKGGLFSLFHKP